MPKGLIVNLSPWIRVLGPTEIGLPWLRPRRVRIKLLYDMSRNMPDTLFTLSEFLFFPDRGAEYCDGRVCLCVCLCVTYPCVCLSVREHISGNTRLTFTSFLCMLPIAVARSSSGDVAICYVLPVLRMTSCLRISQWSSTWPRCWWKHSPHASLCTWL